MWRVLGSCLFSSRRWLPSKVLCSCSLLTFVYLKFWVRAIWGGRSPENGKVPHSQHSLVVVNESDLDIVGSEFFLQPKIIPSVPFIPGSHVCSHVSKSIFTNISEKCTNITKKITLFSCLVDFFFFFFPSRWLTSSIQVKQYRTLFNLFWEN